MVWTQIRKSLLLVTCYRFSGITETECSCCLVLSTSNLLTCRLVHSSNLSPLMSLCFLNPSLTPTFAYFLQSPYSPRFSYGLCVLQILFFLYGECFKFNLSYICFACFEGLLHWRISMFSPNGFFPFVVTSFWVLIRRTISVQ